MSTSSKDVRAVDASATPHPQAQRVDAKAKARLAVAASQGDEKPSTLIEVKPGASAVTDLASQIAEIKGTSSAFSSKVQSLKNRWDALEGMLRQIGGLAEMVVSASHEGSARYMSLGLERHNRAWYLVGGFNDQPAEDPSGFASVSTLSIDEMLACVDLIEPLIQEIRERIDSRDNKIERAIEMFDDKMAAMGLDLSDELAKLEKEGD